MNIVLARIDDRLIHGQVATSWAKATDCQRIIVCDDDVAADEIRSELLKQVAPPGVKASVVNIDKMARAYANPRYKKDRCVILFTKPAAVLVLIRAGVPISSVNIGGMSYKDGKRQITDAISVDETDVAVFRELAAAGIELEVRKVAGDAKINLLTLLK